MVGNFGTQVGSSKASRAVRLQELFQRQVEIKPGATAIMFGQSEITYGDLNCKANRLANLLRHKGVKAGAHVGVCMSASIELVLAYLGILKAGAVYVPIDPSYPGDRIKYICNDAELCLLLTDMRTLENNNLVESCVEAIPLDSSKSQSVLSEQPHNDFDPGSIEHDGRDLAYIIYTSGSTGRPKGVMVEHVGLVNLYRWYESTVYQGRCERNLLISSIAFDLTQKNIFSTLIGGHILIIPEMSFFDRDIILATARSKNATIINCAPSAWNALSKGPNSSTIPTLKTLVLGGEKLDKVDFQKFRSNHPSAQVYNTYGPTECSDVTSFYLIPVSDPLPINIPIGRGIPNTNHYILDDELNPVRPGNAGELYIGGICLARGYLNDQERTDRFFIKNSKSKDPNERIYKTGDVCRINSDGNMEYIGRADRQIKIAGIRVELDEIESILCEHEFVTNAAAVYDGNESVNNRFVAYVESSKIRSVEVLKEYLKRRLPKPLVPNRFVLVEEFPLTTNGKTCFTSLRKGFYNVPDFQEEEMTEIERQIHKIWVDVLGFEKVGVNDDLFSLGGDSIMAVIIFTSINELLGTDIHVAEMFSSEIISIRWLSQLVTTSIERRQSSIDEIEILLKEIENMSDEEVADKLTSLS